jgi:mono/diheme cytochrome c family protein
MTMTSGRSRWAMASASALALLAWAPQAPAQAKKGDANKGEWVAPAEAHKLQNPVKGDGQTVERGRKLYERHCVPCHGVTGAGDGPMATRLGYRPRNLTLERMNQLSDGELFWKISKGRDPMPVFENEMSARERWDVISYIRTLVRAIQ